MSRAASIKIPDPVAHFADWHFAIDDYHYGTLGVELKTFVSKKVPYLSYAMMTPPDYSFCQGYIFYSRVEPNHFLQVGAEQGLSGLEVFEGWTDRPACEAAGWLTTASGLAHWLKVGTRPETCREMDFAQSKSGLMAWRLIKPAAIEP